MTRTVIVAFVIGLAAACGAGLPLPANGGDAGAAADAGGDLGDGGDLLDCTGLCRKGFICVSGACVLNCDMPTETCP